MANPKENVKPNIQAQAQAQPKEQGNINTNTVTDIQGTGTLAGSGVHKQGEQQEDFKLVSEGATDAERNLKFSTGAQLKKYQEDMRIINNLQVDDPMRYQEANGFYPRRGSSLEIKEDMKGLSQQDRLDVVAGRKTLESADQNKGTYRAV
jgi:hypothetical protein